MAAPHNQWYEMGAGLLVWLTNDRRVFFQFRNDPEKVTEYTSLLDLNELHSSEQSH